LRGWLETVCVRRASEVFVQNDFDRVRALLDDAQRAVDSGCSWGEYRALDEQFHSAIWAASGNARAIELLRSLNDSAILDPTFQLGLEMPTQGNMSIAEHREIVDAIESRDPVVAESAMDRHVNGYLQLLAEQLLGRPRSRSGTP
jgi:DNA-binding GntR family transcriptional regulator